MIDFLLRGYRNLVDTVALLPIHEFNFDEKDIESVFFPYRTGDCILLHAYFLRIMYESYGIKGKLVLDPKDYCKEVASNRFPRSPGMSYRELYSFFLDKTNGSSAEALGLFEHLRRICDVGFFFGDQIELGYHMEKVFLHRQAALEVVSLGKRFVLPDVSYAFARTIHAKASLADKQVFLLNPHGVFRNVTGKVKAPTQSPTANECISEIQMYSKEKLNQLDELAESYMIRRMQGRVEKDLEARKANVPHRTTKADLLRDKKILMLHCIRDANRYVPSVENNIIKEDFIDYFEWTDWAFRQISTNPHEWLIRLHPNNEQYSGEKEIIDRLAEIYGLKDLVIDEACSTKEIIESGSPVFTHSGTVVLESAAQGRKVFSVNSILYPKNITIALHAENMESYYQKKVSSLKQEMHMETDDVILARRILYLTSKEARPIFHLIAKFPQKQTTGLFRTAFREQKALFGLGRNIINPRNNKEFHKIIEKHLEEIT